MKMSKHFVSSKKIFDFLVFRKGGSLLVDGGGWGGKRKRWVTTAHVTSTTHTNSAHHISVPARPSSSLAWWHLSAWHLSAFRFPHTKHSCLFFLDLFYFFIVRQFGDPSLSSSLFVRVDCGLRAELAATCVHSPPRRRNVLCAGGLLQTCGDASAGARRFFSGLVRGSCENFVFRSLLF